MIVCSMMSYLTSDSYLDRVDRRKNDIGSAVWKQEQHMPQGHTQGIGSLGSWWQIEA